MTARPMTPTDPTPHAPADASAATRHLVDHFYGAFARRDWRAMAAAYAPQVHFTDPAFDLHGDEARAMWRMLCESAKDFRATHEVLAVGPDSARVRWQAWYLFSRTGRPVHNIIEARWQLANGLVVRHEDHFDFWRWSRQALGLPGLLLGWSPMLKNKVRASAAASLRQYIATHPA